MNLSLGALLRSIPTPRETTRVRSRGSRVRPDAQANGTFENVINGPMPGTWTWPPWVWPATRRSASTPPSAKSGPCPKAIWNCVERGSSDVIVEPANSWLGTDGRIAILNTDRGVLRSSAQVPGIMTDPAVRSPDFAHPPVVEVVFGVLFAPIPTLGTPQLGLLWQRVKDDFPKVAEQPPLPPAIETFDEPASFNVEFGALPPLRRIWFVSSDDRRFLQVQPDRFHYNRKRSLDEAYTPFVESSPAFLEHFGRFKKFVRDECDGAQVVPIQYELTYVDLIKPGEGWAHLGEIGSVFPDLSWRSGSRFLPKPESVQWRAKFKFPEKRGRMHVVVSDGTTDAGEPVLQMQLTARGFWKEAADDPNAFFTLAHEWVVRGFTDLTSDPMHAFWGRTR